ncbi:MAG: hypothetical protein AB1414_18530 [bacterium]
MMIKIIDWISRITAILLVIVPSCGIICLICGICGFFNTNPEIGILIGVIIVFSILQLSLFLAPAVRHKGIGCKLAVALGMLPGVILCLAIFAMIPEMLDMPFSIFYITLCCMISIFGLIIYLIQYVLLFLKTKE